VVSKSTNQYNNQTMKSILTTTVLIAGLLIQTMGLAQTSRKADQIVKRNKQVVQAIITEINETQVLYRDPTKPKNTLPIAINKSEINKLVYANGQEESIDHGDDNTPPKKSDKISIFVAAGGGGAMMSSPILSLIYKSSPALSYSGGLGIHVPIGKYLAVAPMATFAQFGGKLLGLYYTDEVEVYSYQSAQVSLPILFTSPPAGIRFFGGVGPYMSYNFGSTYTKSDSGILSVEKSIDFETEQKALHFGGMVQVGLQMKKISVFGYYTRSFTQLEKVVITEPTVSTFGLGLKVHF
jgi:hypothetical protein